MHLVSTTTPSSTSVWKWTWRLSTPPNRCTLVTMPVSPGRRHDNPATVTEPRLLGRPGRLIPAFDPGLRGLIVPAPYILDLLAKTGVPTLAAP